MNINRARGWRRIGLILSVIWFLGFGLFLWQRTVEDIVQPYSDTLKTCGEILDIDNEALQYLRTVEEIDRRQSANFAKYKKCQTDAEVTWNNTLPSNWLTLAVVVGVDLVTIALGWLVVWIGIVIVRWVQRGFASA